MEFKRQDDVIEALYAQLDQFVGFGCLNGANTGGYTRSGNEFGSDGDWRLTSNGKELGADGDWSRDHGSTSNGNDFCSGGNWRPNAGMIGARHIDDFGPSNTREFEYLRGKSNESLHENEKMSSGSNSSERLDYISSESKSSEQYHYIMSNQYSNENVIVSDCSSWGYSSSDTIFDQKPLYGTNYSYVNFNEQLEHEGTDNSDYNPYKPNFHTYSNAKEYNIYHTDISGTAISNDNRLAPITSKNQTNRKKIDNPQLDTELFSIGQNDDGQLGILNTLDGHPYSSKFKKTSINDSLLSSSRIQIKKICCGSVFTFVLTTCDRLYAWGLSDITGDDINDYEPREINLGLSVLDVACTEYAVCVIDEQNRLWTWGSFRVISKLTRIKLESCI
jgi:hypothetical protein